MTSLHFQPEVCVAPHALLLSQDEKTAFVVCEGNHTDPGTVALVSVLNPATPAVTKVITVGVFPDDAFFVKGAP